jgi:hypothetical protein
LWECESRSLLARNAALEYDPPIDHDGRHRLHAVLCCFVAAFVAAAPSLNDFAAAIVDRPFDRFERLGANWATGGKDFDSPRLARHQDYFGFGVALAPLSGVLQQGSFMIFPLALHL